MKSFLLELNSHRKGAKSAEGSGFSLAATRNGKRKGPVVNSDQVDLSAVPFSFPLSQRKAEKNQPLRPPCLPAGRCVSAVNLIRSALFPQNIIDVSSEFQLFFLIQVSATFESLNQLIRLGVFFSQLSNSFILNHRPNLKSA